MAEDRPPELDPSIPPRLRPLVARLLEIERKCRGLGPRNEEARDMAARLQAIVGELSAGGRDGAPPPRFRELARQLFPVARLFESLGFMSVAREVGHVEKLLVEMEPAAPPPAKGPIARAVAPAATDAPPPALEPPDPGTQPQRTPHAVAAGLAVLVLAAVAAVAVVIRYQPGRQLGGPGTIQPAIAGTPAPTAAPEVARPSPTPGPRSRLADLIGQARLAEQAGDLDQAISLLGQAAEIDLAAGAVHETAGLLVVDLVARSDQAAGDADWQRAAALLERARGLALRFELPTTAIDQAERRQGGLERYQRLGPSDLPALRAAVGSRAIVHTTDDAVREGRLVAVSGSTLTLQLGIEVAAHGSLLHTFEVPLSSVREVRVYPE